MVEKYLILLALISSNALEIGCAGQSAPGAEKTIGGKTAGEVFGDSHVAALARGACEGDRVKVRDALKAGANPNGRGVEGVTPLLWAQTCESVAGVEALLQARADPNQAAEGNDFTPVLAAASIKNPAILKLLLAHGGDPNASGKDRSWTALRVAFGVGMDGNGWSNYYALLDAGADINRDNQGQTIANFAVAMNQYDKVADLLDRGYSFDLAALAKDTSFARLDNMEPDQIEWLRKVRLALAAKGIVVPPPVSQD